MGQGQPRVIIRTTLVVLAWTMLHTKFQGHRSGGSGEDFFKVFTIYGHGSHVGYVTQLICINFLSISLKLSCELWFQIAQLFLRKTSYNIEILVTFDHGQRMVLTFDTHSTS